MRSKTLSWLLVRPWFHIPIILWISVSMVYYWWLISRISVLENQNNMYRSQLRWSQNTLKQMTEDSLISYRTVVIPDTVGSLCETIHVAIVCMGKCTNNITPMLKSMLHHRQNPLHFHFIVDSTSQHVFMTLMKTWDLPDVQYTCYNAENKLSKLKWIPNTHYSGIFGLVKLLLPEILPESLGQVIALDTDLTFLCDIAELWVHFRNMTESQFIGVVENTSNWYFEQDSHWPATGRGFNTGIMLLDLKKIRVRTKWNQLWQYTIQTHLMRLKQVQLADQDAVNAIIKDDPGIVYHISCLYNVQMSTQTLAKKCYGEDKNKIKIIHWNSPSKYNIRIRDADYFKNIYQSYVNLDGNLLREKLHRCYQNEVVTYKINHSDLCLSFRAAQRVKLRTHLYYMDYSYTNIDNFDVTLVLQLSMDRLQFLERLVKYWEGPLSAAIYLSDCEVPQFQSFIKEWSDTLSQRTNIGYHLVFKHDSVHYPVNYLRNIALQNVNTPYVFLMDVDFVPMAGLYQHLRDSIHLIDPYPQKLCLVVAAFETQRYRASPPKDKQALLGRWSKSLGDVAPFRAREWPKGHRATNYTRWAKANEPYEVDWESDYEPYLVVHRSVPEYDTRFSGFGWNKVSHSVELRAQGYHPVVLPSAFVVHTAHAPSHDITAFRQDKRYRMMLASDKKYECLALLKQEFMDDLKRKYNVTWDEGSKMEFPNLTRVARSFSKKYRTGGL